MTQFSLFVELKAKPSKAEEFAAFLVSAQRLVAAERGTIAWFAVRFDSQTFAIFDAFEDESARSAHLAGRVAAALMERADEFLAAPPQIRSANVLAEKLPLT